MLQKIKMVDILPLLYNGQCTIIVREKKQDKRGVTVDKEVIQSENVPCRLSHTKIEQSKKYTNLGHTVSQTVKLFLAPDVEVPTGSKIIVTQNGVTKVYRNCGESAIFSGHQEIALEIFEEWV